MSTKEASPDHLVLCVHGIGNQVSGDTVGEVLSGALAEHDRQGRPHIVADETIVNLFETPYEDYKDTSRQAERPYPGGEGTITTPIHDRADDEGPKREGMQQKFPMYIKRIRPQGAPNSDVRTVLTEVYWADLSPEPKGAFATIFDLIKVTLSVGYLALDNAANVKANAAYRMILCYLWALIGGVVALNAALLMGVLVLMLEGSIIDFSNSTARALPWLEWPIAALAAASLALGLVANQRPAKDPVWTFFGYCNIGVMVLGMIGLFVLPAAEATMAAAGMLTLLLGRIIGRTRWNLSLWRIFSIGAGMWGLLILLSVPFAPEVVGENYPCPALVERMCDLVGSEGLEGEARQVLLFVAHLQFILSMVWGIAVVFCILVYGAWIIDCGKYEDSAPDQQRRIYAPICSGLLFLWMILASCFWVGVQRATENFRTATHEVQLIAKDVLPGGEAVVSHDHKAVGVLATGFETLLNMFLPFMAVAVAFLLILVVVGGYVVVRRFLNKHVLFHATTTAPTIGRILLNVLFQGVFALSTLAFAMVAILSVQNGALDWMLLKADDANPTKLARLLPYVPAVLLGLALLVYQLRDLVAGGLGAFRDIVVYANNEAFDPKGSIENFPPRQQIERRFERVCQFMMGQIKPKRVTVISHSQGTVVATRNLRRLLKAGMFKGCDVTLITMGSPVTHIYRKYFPSAFQIEKGDFDNDGKPITWFNIGRTDDFVGTFIEGLDELNDLPAAPVHASQRNLLVPAGGHPGYFTDPYVWQLFTDKIDFKLL